MTDTSIFTGTNDTALLNLIEKHVSCAMFTLGPRTAKSAPFYLLSLTLLCGEMRTFTASTRRLALVQAAQWIGEHQAEAA